MPFVYKKYKDLDLSLSEFISDARDLACHYRKTIDIINRTNQWRDSESEHSVPKWYWYDGQTEPDERGA